MTSIRVGYTITTTGSYCSVQTTLGSINEESTQVSCAMFSTDKHFSCFKQEITIVNRSAEKVK